MPGLVVTAPSLPTRVLALRARRIARHSTEFGDHPTPATTSRFCLCPPPPTHLTPVSVHAYTAAEAAHRALELIHEGAVFDGGTALLRVGALELVDFDGTPGAVLVIGRGTETGGQHPYIFTRGAEDGRELALWFEDIAPVLFLSPDIRAANRHAQGVTPVMLRQLQQSLQYMATSFARHPDLAEVARARAETRRGPQAARKG